jgi:hypothetical protein
MMIVEVNRDSVRTEGCGCCSSRYALTPDAGGDGVLTREMVEESIEEMEYILEQLRDILEGLPKGE